MQITPKAKNKEKTKTANRNNREANSPTQYARISLEGNRRAGGWGQKLDDGNRFLCAFCDRRPDPCASRVRCRGFVFGAPIFYS